MTISTLTGAGRPTRRWLDAALGSGAWVDAQPFRAHLAHLAATSGLHWRVVACYCGLPARTARRLIGAHRPADDTDPPLRRISRVSAARLLAVGPAHLTTLPYGTVPADATAARLHRLVRRGHSARDVVETVYADEAALTRLLPERAPGQCSRLLQVQVAAAWEHLVGDAEPDPGER